MGRGQRKELKTFPSQFPLRVEVRNAKIMENHGPLASEHIPTLLAAIASFFKLPLGSFEHRASSPEPTLTKAGGLGGAE